MANTIKVAISDSVAALAKETQGAFKARNPPSMSRIVSCLLRFACHDLSNRPRESAINSLRKYRSAEEGDTHVILVRRWREYYKDLFVLLGEVDSFSIALQRQNICNAALEFIIADRSRPELIRQVYKYHRQALREERKDARQLWFDLFQPTFESLSKQVGIDSTASSGMGLSPDSAAAYTNFIRPHLEPVKQMTKTELDEFVKRCLDCSNELDAKGGRHVFLLVEDIDASVTDLLDKVRGEIKLDAVLRGAVHLALGK